MEIMQDFLSRGYQREMVLPVDLQASDAAPLFYGSRRRVLQLIAL